MIAFVLITASVGMIVSATDNDYKACLTNYCSAPQESAGKDTTIYDGLNVNTAELQDAIEYFRQNNRFKDWDKNDKRVVILRGIVEKDGTISNVGIGKSSNVKKLDDEALRLIKSAKYTPASTGDGQIVRSKFAIVVPFPAQ